MIENPEISKPDVETLLNKCFEAVECLATTWVIISDRLCFPLEAILMYPSAVAQL